MVQFVTFVTFCYLLNRGQEVIEVSKERRLC